jgi:hypothetical protein
MAKNKYIETPDKLWEYFEQYKEQTKSKPFLVKDWVGKDAEQVHREKERPLTIEGFECWLFDNGIISDLGDYFSNKNNNYSDYSTICSRVKKAVRKDQIEGGMSGMYNPSITQRLNGLVEKTQTDVKVTKFEFDE